MYMNEPISENKRTYMDFSQANYTMEIVINLTATVPFFNDEMSHLINQRLALLLF